MAGGKHILGKSRGRRVTNLCADIDLPRLKNDDFLIDVKRMSFGEQSGFEVKQISTHIAIAPHSATR